MTKTISVAFISRRLKAEFDSLRCGRYEDKQIYSFIERAIAELKQNPTSGTKIPSALWPKQYRKLGVTNLWKHDLPDAWRLIYTIAEDEIMIVSIILEWFDHKEYEKRFRY
jgi:Txe/YoeB family toxin of Txe-Axe toxin-antitoxin module